MGVFAGLNNVLEQKLAQHRQDQVLDRQRQLDDLERSIQIYQAGGGTNPDGTPMTPQQRQQAIQGAVSQRISLSTPEEGPQLFEKLRDLFHGGKNKPGALPTATGSQPWDEKIPGVTTNPQTGVPVVPKGGGQDKPQQPMATHNPADLVRMAQQGSMSLEQIMSGATPPPQPLHQLSDAPKRGADGKYYMWYANTDGSNPHRVEVPDWNDETSLQGQYGEWEKTYEALHDGATPPQEMKDKWFAIHSKMEAPEGKAGATPKPKTAWIKTSQGLANVQLDAQNHAVPGTENYDIIPPVGLLPHIRTGMYTYPDADGNLHQVPTTSTSQAAIPTKGASSAASPKAAAPAALAPGQTAAPSVKAAPAPAPQNATTLKNKGERVIGYKGSDAYKQLSKAAVQTQVTLNHVNNAVNLVEQSADKARAGDGPAQVTLISAYLKGIVGGQGVRITQAEWNAAAQTRPWMNAVGAHFTDDGFYSYHTNVLSKEQIDSLIEQLKNKAEATSQELRDIKAQTKAQKQTDTSQSGGTTNPDQTKEEIKKLLRMK